MWGFLGPVELRNPFEGRISPKMIRRWPRVVGRSELEVGGSCHTEVTPSVRVEGVYHNSMGDPWRWFLLTEAIG